MYRYDWPDRFLQELEKLEKPSSAVEEYVEALPNSSALDNAGKVLRMLDCLGVTPSSIGAMGDGGVGIAFCSQDRYGDIECFNNGKMFASWRQRGKEPIVVEVVGEENIECAVKLILSNQRGEK